MQIPVVAGVFYYYIFFFSEIKELLRLFKVVLLKISRKCFVVKSNIVV